MDKSHKVRNFGEIRHLPKTLIESRFEEIKTLRLCWLVILALLFGVLTDVEDARAQIFELAFGTSGSGDGQFFMPEDIAVDVFGNIYVADTINHRIQKFSSTGTFILKFGTRGTGDGQFIAPSRIAVDDSGNIYEADDEIFAPSISHRIQKFDSNGNFLFKFGRQGSGDGEFSALFGIAVDGSANIYVADRLNNRIEKFDSNGNFLFKFGTQGSGNGQFNQPNGVAVDGSGNIYVADTNNNRIQVFGLKLSLGADLDLDGIPNSSDIDADNDGIPNADEVFDAVIDDAGTLAQ